jgi:adenylate cyclase
MIDKNKLSGLVHWLAAGAQPYRLCAEVVEETGQRLVSAGLPVDQFGVYQTMIHPALPGNFSYWTKGSGVRKSVLTPEQLRSGDLWIGTPAFDCQETGRIVVTDLGASPKYDHRRDMKHLLERGYRQILNLPLHSVHSIATNVASFSTKKEGGFTEEETRALKLIQANLARVVEGHILHESAVQILSTYVGRDAGIRILEGNIMLGDSETIPSIVLFADLKNFTALSNVEKPKDVIETLNIFYEIAESAINRNGGEILKFMGDGLLAIFPVQDDLSAQIAGSIGAISALEETRATLMEISRTDISFRASLHLGDINYGNIGSKSRMDFTAIGPTVNLAARLLSAADEYSVDTVCSKAFHQLVPETSTLLGEKTLKGFDDLQPVYGISSNDASD